MKKKILLIPLVLLLAISLVAAACAPPTPTPTPTPAPEAEVIVWKLQSAMSASEPQFKMLQNFVANVEKMSGGRLKIDALPSGAVVPAFEITDAVNERVVDAGMHWVHYSIGKHPAAGLFSSPPGSSGTGLDQTSLLDWYWEGEGMDLLDEFNRDIIGVDLKTFMTTPDGPEMLGWFSEPIETLDEFRKLRYRVSSGLAQDVYLEMGASPVAMSGSEIVPALERGIIDAAERNIISADIAVGLHEIRKFLSLGGLHQTASLSDIIINGEVWRELPEDLQAIVEIATRAMYIEAMTSSRKANAEALVYVVEEAGVTIFPAPPGYEEEFTRALNVVLAKLAAEYPFFKKVLDSQRAWGEKMVPYQTEFHELYAKMGRVAMAE